MMAAMDFNNFSRHEQRLRAAIRADLVCRYAMPSTALPHFIFTAA